MQLDDIISVYEASKHWYEYPSEMPKLSREVPSLEGCLDGVELVLLDSYGVLCRGPEVIHEALHAIDMLRKKNIPFCIVSNDSMNGWRTVEGKYQKLGFGFKKSEIVTSLDVTEHYLKNTDSHENIAATCYGQNPIQDDFPKIHNLNATEGLLHADVKRLMYLVGAGWQKNWQDNLVTSAKKLEEVLIANPDVGAPSGSVFVPTPGLYMHDFYMRTGFSKKPTLLGKPDAKIFQYALDFMDYKGKPENVLMVGDSLHTDILGGLNMGFKTLLVESGIFTGGLAKEYIEKTGIVPHYIAPHV